MLNQFPLCSIWIAFDRYSIERRERRVFWDMLLGPLRANSGPSPRLSYRPQPCKSAAKQHHHGDIMKSVVLEAFGDAVNLHDAELPAPSPGATDILIRTKAVGFNPIDHQVRSGGFDNLTPPVVLGFDVSGTVERIGAEVSRFSVGDQVMAWLGGPSLAGGYAEFAVAPENLATKIPPNISVTEAAAIPVGALTALRSLRRVRFAPQKSLLVAGGAGGVGSWALLLCAALGGDRIITTAGSDGSEGYIAEHLGIDASRILRYEGLSRDALVAKAISLNAGELFDITLDCVGDSMTRLCCDAVGYDGAVVSIVNGPRSNPVTGGIADEDVLFNKSAEFHFELLFAQTEYAPARPTSNYARDLDRIADLLKSGRLHLPKITEIGALNSDTVRRAHSMLESGHTRGKLIATIP